MAERALHGAPPCLRHAETALWCKGCDCTPDGGNRVVDRLRRVVGIIIAMVLVAGTLTVISLATPAPAEAADGSDFDPGHLITDENFYNGNAMGASAVQDFIVARNSTCSSAFACLFNYRQDTPPMSASAYCQSMPGQPSEPASSIIARVGAACGISQRALLVILQKEQSLVTSSSPTRRSFEAATGFACPDTAACDSAYGGFFYQVYYAARQFQVYKAHPTSFNHQPLSTNAIRYHPDPACGTSEVFILNSATAGLFNYTPYQPNPAALGNLYGTGDACSAYGNRNFWRIWTDWFGSPTEAWYNLFRATGTVQVYLISGKMRYPIATDMVSQYSSLGAVLEVSQAQLDGYRQGAAASRAVRTSDGTTYLIDRAGRLRFSDCAQVADFGLACGAIPMITRSQIVRIPDHGPLSRLIRLPDGSTWFMEGGQRREVPDVSVLAPFGYTGPPSDVTLAGIGSAQIGAPVLAYGVYGDGTGSFRVETGGGTMDVSAAAAPIVAPFARTIRPESMSKVRTVGSLPIRLAAGSRYFILVEGGWLEVSAADYGGSSAFTSASPWTYVGLPLTAVRTTAHFIRERSSAQVFLVSGGNRQPVLDEASREFISRTYGVENRVWVTADGGLAGVIQHIPGLVTAKGPDGVLYLIDGDRRFRFRDCGQAGDFGQSCASIPSRSATELNRYADGGALANLIRLPDDSIWFMQAGVRMETPDPTVLAPYGVPSTTTTLPTMAMEAALIGPPVLRAGTYTDGIGNYRHLTPGANYRAPAAAVAMIGSVSAPVRAQSLERIPVWGELPLRIQSSGRFFVLSSGGWLEVDPLTYGRSPLFTGVASRAWETAGVVASRPTSHFVREASGTQVYLVSGGYLSPVASQAAQDWIARTYGVENRVWVVADGTLGGMPVAVDLSADAVYRAPDGTPILLDDHRAFRFTGCDQVRDFGRTCEALPVIPSGQLAELPDAGRLSNLVRLHDGSNWLVQSAARRETPDPTDLAPYGIPAEPTALRTMLFDALPILAPAVHPGSYTPGDGRQRLVTNAGNYDLGVSVANVFGLIPVRLQPTSFDRLASSGTLPARMATGGRAFIAVQGGWLEVAARTYGGDAYFTALPTGAATGVPIVGARFDSHFAREISSSQVVLISGGYMYPVADRATQDFISATYGVENRIWVTADGALASIPVGR